MLSLMQVSYIQLSSELYTLRSHQLKREVQALSYKLLAIPAIFVLLHIWSIIQGILFDYMQLEVGNIEFSPPLTLALFYLSVSIVLHTSK